MSKWTRLFVVGCLTLGFAGLDAVPVRADGVGETVNEAASDTKKAVRKNSRKVKDKTCEMVDGKLNCAGKKLKHKAQNAGDEINDKVEDLKD